MKYELAKKLKGAGFPQEHRAGVMADMDQMGKPFSEKEFVYIPTLSELIEACGDTFTAINREPQGDWFAFGGKETGHGSTPEEAVANLWLALNNHE